MSRVAVAVAAAALIAACRPSGPPAFTDQQRAAVADSARIFANELATWMGTQGAGRPFSSFFDSTASVIVASDGRISAASFDSVVSRYRGWAPPAGAALTWDSLRVEALGPGLAHFTGAFKESFTPPSGPAYEGHGVMSAVVVHRPSGWKIAAQHTSIVPQQGGR